MGGIYEVPGECIDCSALLERPPQASRLFMSVFTRTPSQNMDNKPTVIISGEPYAPANHLSALIQWGEGSHINTNIAVSPRLKVLEMLRGAKGRHLPPCKYLTPGTFTHEQHHGTKPLRNLRPSRRLPSFMLSLLPPSRKRGQITHAVLRGGSNVKR